MKIEQLIDQKRLLSHILIVLVSVCALIIIILRGLVDYNVRTVLSMFLLISIQLEVFILIASGIFKELPTGLGRI